MAEPTYKPQEVRDLLVESFTNEELRQIIDDEFSSLSDSLPANSSLLEMARRLIEHCRKKSQMDRLLAIVREKVPERYAEAEASLIDETANIRELLKVPFITDRKFRQRCYLEFKPVFEKFGQQTDIAKLVEYCVNNRLLDRLLIIIKEQDPQHYAKHEKGVRSEIERLHRIQQEELPQPEANLADNLIVGDKKAEFALPDENEFLQKILVQKTRELYDLQFKASQFGAHHTPFYITSRIEDLQKEIDELNQKLSIKH